jgi:hypothetical protein
MMAYSARTEVSMRERGGRFIPPRPALERVSVDEKPAAPAGKTF